MPQKRKTPKRSCRRKMTRRARPTKSPKTAEIVGGSGGECVPTTRDCRLAERVVRQNWQIADHGFVELPTAMLNVALGRGPLRARIAAARAVISMHGQNQANNPAPLKHEHTGSVDVGENLTKGVIVALYEKRASSTLPLPPPEGS